MAASVGWAPVAAVGWAPVVARDHSAGAHRARSAPPRSREIGLQRARLQRAVPTQREVTCLARNRHVTSPHVQIPPCHFAASTPLWPPGFIRSGDALQLVFHPAPCASVIHNRSFEVRPIDGMVELLLRVLSSGVVSWLHSGIECTTWSRAAGRWGHRFPGAFDPYPSFGILLFRLLGRPERISRIDRRNP